MNNTSIYRIITLHTPFVLRAVARLNGLMKAFVSYLQYLCLRHELFADETTLQAYMTPQVCYLEKILQAFVSPQASISPQGEDVILFRADESAEPFHFIDDGSGQVFFTDLEFAQSWFIVFLPAAVSQLTNYARELLDTNKLPGTHYTIILQ